MSSSPRSCCAAAKVPLFFLEFDTPRAGSLEVLRHLGDDKGAVLGLVSTKTGALESRDTLLERLNEAASYAPKDRLALSPQCGFASVEAGNPLTAEEQTAKLQLVAEVAAEFWA